MPTDSGPIDADLRRVVEAWPELPEAIRRAVLAMVSTVTGVTVTETPPDDRPTAGSGDT